jgi:hypothetical protein
MRGGPKPVLAPQPSTMYCALFIMLRELTEYLVNASIKALF